MHEITSKEKIAQCFKDIGCEDEIRNNWMIGDAWLAELKEYLQSNKNMVAEFLKTELPELNIVSMEATYLLWIDCCEIGEYSNNLAKHIRESTG